MELMHPAMIETSDYISMYMSGDKWHVIKSRKGSDWVANEDEHNQLLSESLNSVCLDYRIVRTGADSHAIL